MLAASKMMPAELVLVVFLPSALETQRMARWASPPVPFHHLPLHRRQEIRTMSSGRHSGLDAHHRIPQSLAARSTRIGVLETQRMARQAGCHRPRHRR
jgi:hypothetical protein